jgi:hypothetical protein
VAIHCRSTNSCRRDEESDRAGAVAPEGRCDDSGNSEIYRLQNHTIRGFISGTLTKKMGLTINSMKSDSGERTYRIAE